jgi:hypothetical protein
MNTEHSGISIPANIVQKFNEQYSGTEMPNLDAIRLHDGILLRMFDTVLSKSHGRETSARESCWVLINAKIDHIQEVRPHIAKVHKFAYCKLPSHEEVDENEAVNGGTPYPYRAALVTVYKTE